MADIIKTATRDAYGKALIELGHKDKNVIPILQKLQEPESLRRNSPIDFLTPA